MELTSQRSMEEERRMRAQRVSMIVVTHLWRSLRRVEETLMLQDPT